MFIIIKAIYGTEDAATSSSPSKGPWSGIVRMMRQLRQKEMNLQVLCPIRVGDGLGTRF